MYFPYLRGRQFELIALRELIENGLIGEHIIPVIEPIKPSPTLLKTINKYVVGEKPIAVIHNPQVGNFLKELNKTSQLRNELEQIYKNDNVIFAHVMNRESREQLIRRVPENQLDNILIINRKKDFIKLYKELFTEINPRFTLVPGDVSYRRNIKVNPVLLEDPFGEHKLGRNADYLKQPGGIFSEDHLFYKDENYVGFSDYSVVGEEFYVGGFAPYAVAIHIVYFDEGKVLRIKHFTSESNEDISDPAGKFGEALEKLIRWHMNMDNNDTYAMREFKQHHENGTYPGLGTIKKLSVMHHIELVSAFLDEVSST